MSLSCQCPPGRRQFWDPNPRGPVADAPGFYGTIPSLALGAFMGFIKAPGVSRGIWLGFREMAMGGLAGVPHANWAWASRSSSSVSSQPMQPSVTDTPYCSRERSLLTGWLPE